MLIIITAGLLVLVTMGIVTVGVVYFTRGDKTQRSKRLFIILGVIPPLIIASSALCWRAGSPLLFGGLDPAPPPRTNTPEPSSIPTSQVIVALQPIAPGSEFVQGSVGRRSWPANNIPPDVIADEAELLGKITKADIAQGQVIVRSMLTDKSDLSKAPQLFAWCDVKDSDTLEYSLSVEAGVEEPTIVLGSSGVVRLQGVEGENQAKISCNRDGFGQVTVNFVDPEAAAKNTILYSCTLPLECQDGVVTVTTYSAPETK